MKNNKAMWAMVLLAVSSSSFAGLIPDNKNGFYYQLGGGQDIPLPAYLDTQTVPLSVDGSIGLGYNCGSFNPKLSITNSLNNIKNSFQNMANSVVKNATAAIAEFPMYELNRANSDMYDIFNNALFGAKDDLKVSTKSCQVMQNEIASGKNPYTDWGTIAMGDDWKYHMSLSSGSSTQLGSDNQDINQVKQQVQKDDGKDGIPWVQGVELHGGLHAGGENQPVIQVVHDTVIAGYNVSLQSDRSYDDTSAPAQTDANQHLVSTWSDPVKAADWITHVVGDAKISTYNQGDKGTIAGVGLLADTQIETKQITDNLVSLVSGNTQPTIKNLQAVSAPRVMINEAVIEALRRQSPVMRSILVSKIAQQAAMAKIIDMSLLARQLLQEGQQVPAIYGNAAAQKDIEQAIQRLDKAINDLLFNVKVNKELVSNTVSDLLASTQGQMLAHSSISAQNDTPTLANGAVSTENN